MTRSESHRLPIRVRFCETDANRHVSQVSYFIYFEEARTRYIEELGFAWNDGVHGMVLVRQWADYRAPAHFPDQLVVLTDIVGVGRSSIRMAHRVVREQDPDRVLCQGESVMVQVDAGQSQSAPWPDELRARLTARLEPTRTLPFGPSRGASPTV